MKVERQLQRGTETYSEQEYKGYTIAIRAYPMGGIKYIIYQHINGKKTKVRKRQVNFELPSKLLQQAKDWIDERESKHNL